MTAVTSKRRLDRHDIRQRWGANDERAIGVTAYGPFAETPESSAKAAKRATPKSRPRDTSSSRWQTCEENGGRVESGLGRGEPR